MSNAILRHELRCYEDATMDIEDLLQNTNNLIRLATPLIHIIRTLDRIRRWEPWSLCLVLLLLINSACFLLEDYLFVCLVFTMLTMAGLGYTHRRTNLLIKFIPPPHVDTDQAKSTDNVVNLDQHIDPAQSDLMDEFRLLLCFMNDVTGKMSHMLLHLYALLKWKDSNSSLRCYTLVLTVLVLHQLLPLHYMVTILLDIFLLQYPIYQYFLVIRTMQSTSVVRKMSVTSKQSDLEDMTESSMYDAQNGRHSDEYDNKTGDSDNAYTGNGDGEEKSEGTSSDDGGVVEFKVGASNVSIASTGSDTGSIGKTKRQGVVGKILKTVKNQGPSGACEGCKANFTTILKRRRLCSHCGNHFCSRCCSYKVTRSMFGATAPAAQTETVSVCFYCFSFLNKSASRVNGESRQNTVDFSATGASTAKDKSQ